MVQRIPFFRLHSANRISLRINNEREQQNIDWALFSEYMNYK